ncbi:MAG: glycosyltransferase [Phycisphaerales bacterium]|nr:glycosyltransferase [Phycisphaerales bacterium]
MEVLLWLWLGLVVVVLGVWLARLVLLGFIERLLPPLHPDFFENPVDDLPSLSVLVAAKDEASNIEACLRSLSHQDHQKMEVIAINDRSEDATGEIIDRLAKEDPRLSAHHVRELPERWFGKNNAMHQGVARSTGQWLCFTDADCVQESTRSLTTAMRYAMEKGADFLSVLPAHQANTFWERVVQPACSGILLLWFNPLTVNKPGRRTAYANGAFMLMRRTCYDAIGGHEAVRDEINEDIHLARKTKQSGKRLLVVSSRDLYSVRMYGTLREIWSGWTRIFSGCFATVRRLLAAVAVLLAFTFVPWLTLITSWCTVSTGGGGSTIWALLQWTSLATCAVQLVVMFIFYALSRIYFLYGLLYPVGALLGLGFLLNAIACVMGRGAITWRGTTYRDGVIKSVAKTAEST